MHSFPMSEVHPRFAAQSLCLAIRAPKAPCARSSPANRRPSGAAPTPYLGKPHEPALESIPRVALVTGAADRLGAAIASAPRGRWLAPSSSTTAPRPTRPRATVAAITRSGRPSRGASRPISPTAAQRAALIAAAAEAVRPAHGPRQQCLARSSPTPSPISTRRSGTAISPSTPKPRPSSRAISPPSCPPAPQGNIVNIIDERVLHLTPGLFQLHAEQGRAVDDDADLAQSLAPRIRVNAIGPGPTLPPTRASPTAALRSVAGRAAARLRRRPPTTSPTACCYLLARRPMTGQMLALDGGKHLEYPARARPDAAEACQMTDIHAKPAPRSSAPSSRPCPPRPASIA